MCLANCKMLTGVAIVIGIAVSWVGATQFAQSTYSPDFNAPFFTTWFSSLDAGGFSRLFPAKFTHRKANTSVLQVCSSHDLHPGVTETNYTDI